MYVFKKALVYFKTPNIKQSAIFALRVVMSMEIFLQIYSVARSKATDMSCCAKASIYFVAFVVTGFVFISLYTVQLS